MNEQDFLIPIGKRMAEIRHARNMTQETLADRLGVTPKHISHVECGTSSLSLKYLMEFCNILECSLDYIIFGTQKDSILAKLPKEIENILCQGNEQEIERLQRYMQIYIEMQKED